MNLGDEGILDACSITPCPSCGENLGYYGDLMKGFTCPECGAGFEVFVEPVINYRCIKVSVFRSFFPKKGEIFKIEKDWQYNTGTKTQISTRLPDIAVKVTIKEKTYKSGVHLNIVGAIDELKKLVQKDYPQAHWLLEEGVEYIAIPWGEKHE